MADRTFKHSEMLSSLRAELTVVEAELAGFVAAQSRQRRLMAAIKAMEGLASTSPEPSVGGQSIPTSGSRPAAGLTGVVQLNLVPPTPRTLLDAAERVLREAQGPLHTKELIARIKKKGLYTDKPYEALRSTLVSQLLKRTDRFRRIPDSPGTYGLAVEHQESA